MIKKRIEIFKGSLHRYLGSKLLMIGLILLFFEAFIAISAPFLSPQDPWEQSYEILRPPSLKHPMGTDNLGRDVLSQIFHGSRISLLFALGAAGISLILGVLLGAISGYYGGWIDDLFSRFFEVFLSLPRFFLIIMVILIAGKGTLSSMAIVGATIWPANAKITRAQVLAVKKQAFVDSAIVSGASDFRVIFHHILPNGLYPVVANSTLNMASAVIFEASLSFLGLGDANVISWGQTLLVAQANLSSWWLSVFPGISICLMALAFNIIGDAINYASNPKLKSP